jgi:hypothetical protein
MTNVFLDIETIPEQPEEEAKSRIAETIKAPAKMTKQETIDDWHNGAGKYAGVKDAAIEKAYRDTSFDAAKGQICSIAWAIEDEDVQVVYSDSGDDGGILRDAFEMIGDSLKGRPPFFIGHYIAEFDLKFIYRRAVINKICPPFEINFKGRHGQHYFDNRIEWCGFKDDISQDNLCNALGIEGKPCDIDGSQVYDFYKAGGIERIAEYNIDDVKKARMIYKRLTFSGGE